MGSLLHSARINNRRDLRLFHWYLSDQDLAILTNRLASIKGIYNADDIFGSNIEIASAAIDQAIRLIKDNEVNRIYTLDFHVVKSLQIPASEFSWIKKSPDACYFTWLFIKSGIHDRYCVLELDIYIAGKIRNGRYPNKHDFIYNKLDLNIYPVDNKERLIAIEDFFDRAPATLKAKFNLMRHIRNTWDVLYHLSVNFPLSPKNKKKCDWAWNYVQKDRSRMSTRRKDHEGHYTGEVNPSSSADSTMLSMLRPSGTFEKYLAVKFSYLFLFVKDDLFIQRFNKAWEIHQYRASSDARERKASLRSRSSNKTSGSKPVSVPPIATTLTELAALSNIFPAQGVQPYDQVTSDNEITALAEKECQPLKAQETHNTPADNSTDGQITRLSLGGGSETHGKITSE